MKAGRPVVIQVEEQLERLVTRDQLCELMQVSKRQIPILERQGLPRLMVGTHGKLVRCQWSQVLEWIDACEKDFESPTRGKSS